MAVPKHKTSKQRTHSRKANWKISKPALAACPKCGELKPTHKVCSHCGYYKDEPVVQIKTEKED